MKMNCSNKTIIIGLAFALTIALAIGVGQVLAVDNLGVFELEGNALDDSGAPLPDDWETLVSNGSYDVFSGIIVDVNMPGEPDKIFTGGHKDIHDVSTWGWKDSGGKPDKNDITNAYAAGYTVWDAGDNRNELIVYFGADRFANAGDAYLSFWFFATKVETIPGGDFSGSHTEDDILILVNYPQGANAVPIIKVAMWDPTVTKGDADYLGDNLREIYDAAVCNGTGDPACAITNVEDGPYDPTNSPWDYTPKSGTPGSFPHESFFEGGVNITELLEGKTPCFSSYMAETRSSESFTATLKDFALGDFSLCEISVQKECDVVRLTEPGDMTDKLFVVDFEGKVINTGAGYFPAGEILTVRDDAGTPGDESDDVTIEIELTENFDPDEEIPFSGSFFSDDNPPNNTVRASITFGEASIPADPFTIECEPLILNPGLTLSKSCWTELETVEPYLVVKVNISGDVCNTGDIPLTVNVEDDVVGSLFEDFYLDKAGDEPTCAEFSRSYYPSQSFGGETCAGDAYFRDQVSASGTHPALTEPEFATPVTANCDLCFECPE